MLEKIRIAVVDDHPIYRDGVVHTLKFNKVGAVVAEGACMEEAVQIAETKQPDIMLLDVGMPGGGIVAAGAIAKVNPAIRIVMLTVSEQEETVLAALRAGAHGYVLKGTKGPELARVVLAVHAGESYVAPGLAARLLSRVHADAAQSQNDQYKLTVREDQILKQVAMGLTNKQIACNLKVSEKTIKYYMTSTMKKLNVHNRVEAVMQVRQGQRQS